MGWWDCQDLLSKINGQVTGLDLRLPTESQWEYPSRSLTKGPLPYYAEDPGPIAWYRDNSGGESHPVKEKQANGFGLYDMLGNVWEWCEDDLRDSSEEGAVDPMGPSSGERALRGGSWDFVAQFARAARDRALPGDRDDDIGFRCLANG